MPYLAQPMRAPRNQEGQEAGHLPDCFCNPSSRLLPSPVWHRRRRRQVPACLPASFTCCTRPLSACLLPPACRPARLLLRCCLVQPFQHGGRSMSSLVLAPSGGGRLCLVVDKPCHHHAPSLHCRQHEPAHLWLAACRTPVGRCATEASSTQSALKYGALKLAPRCCG